MRSLLDMDTIQIEITNFCLNRCSNCTRFVGHVKPYLMDFDFFKRAIDSLIGYPKMIGFQGGEPLLHPQFKEMCEYAKSKIPKDQLGLWTTLPKNYEHYREIIVDTFEHIFLNDHTASNIYHHPCLVGIEEVYPDKNIMWSHIDHCWVQESWSASINPKGAFFCEMAAAFSMLFSDENSKAWLIEPGWWWRIPKDFKEQMEQWCPRCGMAAKLQTRSSIEGIDDISPKNIERLKTIKLTQKLEWDLYKVHDLKTCENQNQMALYKNNSYRNKIAKRYGMFLISPNEKGFWTPYLFKEFKI
jgi:organic radical activating enzyme